MNVDQGGTWVMVFVAAVLLLALGVFASLIQIDKNRDSRRKQESDSLFPRRGNAAKASGQGVDSKLPRIQLNQDKLIIPPPDEARIEAVAPKNDTARRPR